MMASTADGAVPPDDPARQMVVAGRAAGDVRHIALAGNVYSILISGEQTSGRYCLIDMRIPPGGGPPPHRHDFEEMFTLLEGELEFIFRGESVRVGAGETVNIPANAPHFFRNVSEAPARMLCMCTPAGQEEYFLQVADRVESTDSVPPNLTEDEQRARRDKAADLAARYRTEIL
ncbi:cupin domain-containing protein [Streptomonospora wellingtoniae]|uniref:Cupin domain-containing protein n=1 Tax=Streptomonospora wellingtoniae TaxID=3075544 RepID=A0ABU2KNK8_9ACTN|nr:cupin domain-containing protein [Streptomonospora sp. DSM 45055]MDT0300828.1 cupin domain-containing protein [Streptomonospora sp. DSM 45055]